MAVNPSIATPVVSLLLPVLQACIWDSKTLWEEKWDHPKLAAAIASTNQPAPDIRGLNRRIQELKSAPRESDPAWWNDLAGTWLRLGRADEAVKLLEPLTNRFNADYGIHANLGTAYHLLKRYPEAEREIRRDLEINPNAHFGLEKYHLALLQYLVRDEEYRFRHLYVDEFTLSFLSMPVHVVELARGTIASLSKSEVESGTEKLRKILSHSPGSELESGYRNLALEMADSDEPPAYRKQWNLASDPLLEKGVIYMAEKNPREPACRIMLGVVALRQWDLGLAAIAFKQAIDSGSRQVPFLVMHLNELKKYHSVERLARNLGPPAVITLIALLIGYYLFDRRRRMRRSQATIAAKGLEI